MTAVAAAKTTVTHRAAAPITDDNRRIPAVVVGGGVSAAACSLGIVRSLGGAGIPVILADQDRSSPAMHTRFAYKHISISPSEGRPLIEDLLALSADIGTPSVLFLTKDQTVVTVSEYRAELEGRYLFRLPQHTCMTSLMHKPTFQQLAQALGFPMPRATCIRGPSDFSTLANLRFPCIVKPAIKTLEYGRLTGYTRAYKVSSIGQAESVCRQILPVMPDLVVQEWIEGSDDELYFCLQYVASNGRAICSFTGRKLSIWPPDVGVTASCTAAPDAHAILAPLTESFFRKVAFSGMGGIEYKKDARTGSFIMLEPTVGRADGQEEVATLHGANIPLAAYCHELRLKEPEVEFGSKPIIWQDSLKHWQAIRNRSAKKGARPRCQIQDAYWRINDPMPGLCYGLAVSRALMRKGIDWTRRLVCSSAR